MTGEPNQVINFGCRLNSHESEVMLRQADTAGLQNVVIVNTCTVTAEAERQGRQAIRRLAREHPDKKIIVTGCASEVHRQRFAEMSEVAAIIPNDKKLQPESFQKLVPHGQGALASVSGHGDQAPSSRVGVVGEQQRAFVQVQNGCDHRCTFCIIPYGRGASRSLPLDQVIAQTRAAVDHGYQELVFTGVDMASYGGAGGDLRLGGLVRAVLRAVPDLPRLRLSSLDPAAIDDDLWRALAEEPRLMPHWHLSLQAGDDLVLKRMKRRHNRQDVQDLCHRARQLRPDIVFGADVIAGFPTENDAMFQNTHDLIAESGITWLHVFPYSARTGTPAARMPQVHGSQRQERAEILRKLGEQLAAAHHRGLVGQTLPLLVEQPDLGCTPHFAKVRLASPQPVGKIITADCLAVRNNVAVFSIP